MRIGIIGCGNIANIISKKIKIHASYDICNDKCRRLNAKICKNIDELIESSDFIIESASVEAVREYGEKILEKGKNMLIMSVGALSDRDFRESLLNKAKEKGVEIYIPSGAIGGIDLIESARVAGIDSIILRTYKNAKSLGLKIEEKKLIFKGKASEAIKKFPKSVNVSVLLSIASGMDIDVEVYADNIVDNVHVIEIHGKFGEAKFEIKNKPSEENPRTSYLAPLSLISVIESLNEPMKVI